MFNWRKEPKFQETIESGVNGLKERVLKAADFSMPMDYVNSMLDYEAEVLYALDVREAIIKIVENQERLRLRIEAFVEEFERLKTRVGDLG